MERSIPYTPGEAVPQSYYTNSDKEKLVLSYARNFRRQFVQLYRDRKPLLLCPRNEYDVEKFLSTYIRPTLLPHSDLYDFDGAAKFVSSYLAYQPMEVPNEFPVFMKSPTLTLAEQCGNCFEYGILLCSLLIGAGYDAYCVCGYAVKAVTEMDETRQICPLLQKKKEAPIEEEEPVVKKYTVRPPKNLKSSFIQRMEDRQKAKDEEIQRKLREEEARKEAESEKPGPDHFHGLRIHCWVLVLHGKRQVASNFFIEPSTGHTKPMDCEDYLGIECLWNHQNYWVNMQDCGNGLKDLIFDLGDSVRWEFVLPTLDKPLLALPHAEDSMADIDEEAREEEEEQQLLNEIEMPESWVCELELDILKFQSRCPDGQKTTLYKHAKVEKFGEYQRKDGVMTRLITYQDRKWSDVSQVQEWFSHRKDKLQERKHNHRTSDVIELFAPGREHGLKEHRYNSKSPEAESSRVMLFYPSARLDCLTKREETPLEMTEHFEGRDDFLYKRHVLFGKRQKKFGPQTAANQRPIEKIIEWFHRNKKKRATEDVAERVFYPEREGKRQDERDDREERFQLAFHLEQEFIVPDSRTFFKPTILPNQGSLITFRSQDSTAFQANPDRRGPSGLAVCSMYTRLVEDEQVVMAAIHRSENEVREILSLRESEESKTELHVSIFDTARNNEAKKMRHDLEQQRILEEQQRREKEKDYLAPYLARHGNPKQLTKDQADSMRRDCLTDLKSRLVNQANLIQERYEMETHNLHEKQSWFQAQNLPPGARKEESDEYIAACSQGMFRIHILEQRLKWHKELSMDRFTALQQTLGSDPRLNPTQRT